MQQELRHSSSLPAAESAPHPEVTPLILCTTQSKETKLEGWLAAAGRQWSVWLPVESLQMDRGRSLLGVSMYPLRGWGFGSPSWGRPLVRRRLNLSPVCLFLKTFPIAVVQFSRSVVSDSLRPYGLLHARPPCPAPTPGVYSSSCPLSW